MINLALIGPIGGPELLVILVIGLLVFGARLPEVGRSLGKGMMEFKRGLRGVQDEMSGLDRESDNLIDAELTARKNEPLPRTLETLEAQPVETGDPQPDADPAEDEAGTPPQAEASTPHEAATARDAGTQDDSDEAPEEATADPRREPAPELPEEPEGEVERRG